MAERTGRTVQKNLGGGGAAVGKSFRAAATDADRAEKDVERTLARQVKAAEKAAKDQSKAFEKSAKDRAKFEDELTTV